MIVNLHQIQYLQNTTDASIDDSLYLIECAVETIREILFYASKQDDHEFIAVVCDNEWNKFEVTVNYSPNTDIMPHLVSFEGCTYTADFAVPVLASYLYSVELQRLNERLA